MPRDPVFLNARKEALVITGLFAIFCLWSIIVCFSSGYLPVDPPPNETVEVHTVLGMPAWVFWGLFVPWLAVDVVAVWFCFFYMTDDDLGEDEGEAAANPPQPPEKETDHA